MDLAHPGPYQTKDIAVVSIGTNRNGEALSLAHQIVKATTIDTAASTGAPNKALLTDQIVAPRLKLRLRLPQKLRPASDTEVPEVCSPLITWD